MKEWILKIAIGLVLINGLAQLALSQIHILAITKLFVSEIGFYLFMFIIFGMTTALNAYLLESRRGIILLILTSLLASGAGYVYLTLMRADVAAQNSLTMADVRDSWLLVIASIGIYLGGSFMVSWLSWGDFQAFEI